MVEHTIDCATNAAEIADEFAAMGCTCGADKKNKTNEPKRSQVERLVKKQNGGQWNNPEKARPKPQDRIIFTDEIGLFWGYYEATGDGIVAVAGRKRDKVNWEDIGEWILYPKEF